MDIKKFIINYVDEDDVLTFSYKLFDILSYLKIKTKYLPRDLLFLFQRKVRGFDDSETWSLDYTFTKFILPRLKRFRDITPSIPSSYTSLEDWENALDKMINAFEILSKDDLQLTIDKSDEIDEGLRLFVTHYKKLWW